MLASGARLGLARTFEGEELIPSERFFAGGAPACAAIGRKTSAPAASSTTPRGGRALLVFNEELRFPIYRWLRGVGFVDVGNVYPTVARSRWANSRSAWARGAPRHARGVSSGWIWGFRPTPDVRSEMAGLLRPRPRLLMSPPADVFMMRIDGRPFRGHRGELQEVLEVDGHLVEALGPVQAMPAM